MGQPITLSFVATTELKQLVEQWAKEEDRTISATLRQILTKEAARRQSQHSRQEANYQTN